MSAAHDDEIWIAQAIALAALAEGWTSPNPRVGCLLVRDGRVVGHGYHRASGEPHAEALAVAAAGQGARGATLYVNLEPCAHMGRTPPCADLLVRAGVARVVASLQDPDPRVDGRGFERLRRAGVVVDVGLGAAAAERLNEAFLYWNRQRRPLVTLKAALSADGMLAARDGHARWITGESARRMAHRLRLRHDAVLVGGATVRRDDPQLTVRLPGAAAPRLRAVLSASLDLDPRSRLFEPGPGAPVRIYTGQAAAREQAARWSGRAELVGLSERDGRVDVVELVDHLGAAGVQSLLVEGGARTFASFVDAGCAQRGALFMAERIIGARGATPWLDRDAVAAPELGPRLVVEQVVPLGVDRLLLGHFVAAEEDGPCSPA